MNKIWKVRVVEIVSTTIDRWTEAEDEREARNNVETGEYHLDIPIDNSRSSVTHCVSAEEVEPAR
jgi:hypothetical protein